MVVLERLVWGGAFRASGSGSGSGKRPAPPASESESVAPSVAASTTTEPGPSKKRSRVPLYYYYPVKPAQIVVNQTYLKWDPDLSNAFDFRTETDRSKTRSNECLKVLDTVKSEGALKGLSLTIRRPDSSLKDRKVELRKTFHVTLDIETSDGRHLLQHSSFNVADDAKTKADDSAYYIQMDEEEHLVIRDEYVIRKILQKGTLGIAKQQPRILQNWNPK